MANTDRILLRSQLLNTATYYNNMFRAQRRVVRHHSQHVWIIEDTKLIVDNPRNKIVRGYITSEGEVNNVLNNKAKRLALQLGFEFE